MKPAVLVLTYALDEAADAALLLPHRVELLRSTLNALWSEDPGLPADIVVHGDHTSAAIARREHGKRVRVLEFDGDHPLGEALNTLVNTLRERFFVLIYPGVLPTPGWLRELVQGTEHDGMLIGPCLPLGVAEGAQAVALPPRPSNRELRQAATHLRFLEPRHEVVEILAPLCIGIPRNTLNRIGLFDTRYKSLHGLLLDYQKRVRSTGGRLQLARRALLGASLTTSLPVVDRKALLRREPFFTALGEGCPPVAIEIESDDPEGPRLRELANGLVERGIPLSTFSLSGRRLQRPSYAPHIQASTLESAIHGATLALLRSEEITSVQALHLKFAHEKETYAQHENVLRLVKEDHPYCERLDTWAMQISTAARAATGDLP